MDYGHIFLQHQLFGRKWIKGWPYGSRKKKTISQLHCTILCSEIKHFFSFIQRKDLWKDPLNLRRLSFLNGSLFFQEKMCHDMFIVSGYDRSCNSIDIWLPKKDKNIWIFAPKVTFIYFSEHLSFCAQRLAVPAQQRRAQPNSGLPCQHNRRRAGAVQCSATQDYLRVRSTVGSNIDFWREI